MSSKGDRFGWATGELLNQSSKVGSVGVEKSSGCPSRGSWSSWSRWFWHTAFRVQYDVVWTARFVPHQPKCSSLVCSIYALMILLVLVQRMNPLIVTENPHCVNVFTHGFNFLSLFSTLSSVYALCMHIVCVYVCVYIVSWTRSKEGS